MNKTLKLGGIILGLIGAAVLLGPWAFRESTPADKFSVKVISPPPIAPPPTKMGAEPPAAIIEIEDPAQTASPKIEAPEKSQRLLAEIAAALASTDAAAWGRVLNELFPLLLATDRMAAVRLVETLPAGEQRALLLRRLARNWGAADLAGAADWISDLADFSEKKAVFEETCLAISERDPAAAISVWEAVDFAEDNHVLENLVQNWARHEPAAAEKWVLARPPSAQRDQAIARVAYILAQTKPVDAATLIIRELPEGSAQNEAVISILHQWAERDPAGATAWVARFPAGPLADRAKAEIVGQQSQRNGAHF